MKPMNKVRIVSDIHGNISEYVNRIQHCEASVQIGDFGFKQHYVNRDLLFARHNIDPERHVFFGGNHDDYHNLPEFHLGHYGRVPFAPQIFFVRGARSIDQDHRVEGRDWWREEELNMMQQRRCVRAYAHAKPDIVISHDGPDVACNVMFPRSTRFESQTGKLLDHLFNIHQPKTWIFGHWHRRRTEQINGTTFSCMRELGFMDIEFDKKGEFNVTRNKYNIHNEIE